MSVSPPQRTGTGRPTQNAPTKSCPCEPLRRPPAQKFATYHGRPRPNPAAQPALPAHPALRPPGARGGIPGHTPDYSASPGRAPARSHPPPTLIPPHPPPSGKKVRKTTRRPSQARAAARRHPCAARRHGRAANKPSQHSNEVSHARIGARRQVQPSHT